RFIVRLSGDRRETAVDRLDPTIAEAGGDVALEAAWRATLEIALGAVDAIRRWLAGQAVEYDPPPGAGPHTQRFLESLSLETPDLGTIARRLVRLCHALDHLAQLHDDLMRIPAIASGWQPPEGFAAGARALAAWLEASKDQDSAPDPTLYAAIEA